MTGEEFQYLTRETFDNLLKLMESKGAEYQGNSDDRLSNFKRGAVSTGVDPLTILYVYMSKHWDSFSTYVRDTQQGKQRIYSEPIEGRLDDLINYALLGKALIYEKKREEGMKGIGINANEYAEQQRAAAAIQTANDIRNNHIHNPGAPSKPYPV